MGLWYAVEKEMIIFDQWMKSVDNLYKVYNIVGKSGDFRGRE